MELKDFVKATLEQIVDGTKTAQDSIKKYGGIVNPSNVTFQKDDKWSEYDNPMP
jgi:hypothetical protein